MVVENVMFLVLGFLSAGLIGIAFGQALWARAVRLTRRRLEAATPVTLNEFRADKDKLRAVHAVAIRKLEMRNDMLRDKLAALVGIVDSKTTETEALKAERDEQYEAINTLQVREGELVARIRDLERDSAALAARVRQSEEGFDPADAVPKHGEPIVQTQLSGDYRADVEDLLTALAIERQRNAYLEERVRMLLARLEKKRPGALKDEAVAVLRDTLEANSDPASAARLALHTAETNISSAEKRLNALLAEPRPDADTDNRQQPRHLAEDLSREDQLAALKAQVLGVEHTILSEGEAVDESALRSMLAQIATAVSHVVYEDDSRAEENVEESLFERVRKFSDDSFDGEALEPASETASGRVSERMAALRDMQAR